MEQMEATQAQPDAQAAQPQEQAGGPKILAQLPDKYKQDPELVELAKENNWGPIIEEFKKRGERLSELPKAPDNPDGYKISPQGVLQNDEARQAFLKVAHESGMTQAQMEKLAPFTEQLVQAALGETEKAKKKKFSEAKAALTEEWGEDNLEKNLKVVKRAVDRLGGAELTQVFQDKGLDNDPAIVKMFYEVGKMLSEDNLVDGKVGGKKKEPTPYLQYKSPK